MRCTTLCLILLVGVALAAPAAAQSAAPWSAPQAIDVEQPRDPQLAFNRAGGLGVGSLGFGAAATRVLGLRSGGPPVVAARDVGSIEDGPLPYASTRTLSLRRTATNVAGTFRLGYSFGRSETRRSAPPGRWARSRCARARPSSTSPPTATR